MYKQVSLFENKLTAIIHLCQSGNTHKNLWNEMKIHMLLSSYWETTLGMTKCSFSSLALSEDWMSKSPLEFEMCQGSMRIVIKIPSHSDKQNLEAEVTEKTNWKMVYLLLFDRDQAYCIKLQSFPPPVTSLGKTLPFHNTKAIWMWSSYTKYS